MAKNKENKQFTITLSERQLRLLAYACRVTDRLIIGQLDFSLKECCEGAHGHTPQAVLGRGTQHKPRDLLRRDRRRLI